MKIAPAHKRLDLRGGTELDFYRTAKGLRDLGHEVHLFCAEFKIPAPEGTFAHKVPVVAWGGLRSKPLCRLGEARRSFAVMPEFWLLPETPRSWRKRSPLRCGI